MWEEQTWSSWAVREGLVKGGGWRDLGKGVGIKKKNGDTLGNHQAIATASVNNVPLSV